MLYTTFKITHMTSCVPNPGNPIYIHAKSNFALSLIE